MSELTPQNSEQDAPTCLPYAGEGIGLLTTGTVAELPTYSRSLLKIKVPVSVVLATKRESVHDVVELAPGTIVKFSKSCEESLQLYVGDQLVAEGEAVKVGDKFGFRVAAMTLPVEHFLKVRTNKAS